MLRAQTWLSFFLLEKVTRISSLFPWDAENDSFKRRVNRLLLNNSHRLFPSWPFYPTFEMKRYSYRFVWCWFSSSSGKHQFKWKTWKKHMFSRIETEISDFDKNPEPLCFSQFIKKIPNSNAEWKINSTLLNQGDKSKTNWKFNFRQPFFDMLNVNVNLKAKRASSNERKMSQPMKDKALFVCR